MTPARLGALGGVVGATLAGVAGLELERRLVRDRIRTRQAGEDGDGWLRAATWE